MSAETTRTRRSMLVGLGAAAAASAVAVQNAGAQTTGATFRPTRHPEDSWLEAPGAKHRIVIDAPTPHGAGEAVLFANNLYEATKNAYKGTDKDLGIVVVLRHFGTPFGYNDTIWAKYGKAMGAMIGFNDPKTKQPPATNLFNSSAYGMDLPNLGTTLDQVRGRGTRFAICDAATHFFAQQLAGSGGNADAIYKELVANIIPSARMVSAGVVGVTRAQEYGYALIYSA